MRNRRNIAWGLMAAVALIVLALSGCRAFEPEAVIVNKAPETYIIGAPSEHGGGYYHFHVYWYGSDEDGVVERFVWALTDTTVQDEETTDDEEDVRFNPALDASTLEIAHWTARTDSVFDFRIEQGVRQSADMTLHMVAMDDFGDFDRTPARLHFFSNTLGNPVIRFFRIDGEDLIPIGLGEADTVGFGKPYGITWSGSSPNIRGYTPEALASVDTVYPFDDGLFGFKWQIIGDIVPDCSPPTDCWHPRVFVEATGDSVSFFADLTELNFANGTGVPDPDNPFQMLLPPGAVTLLVNSIDVAGVEVAEFQREFKFVVNYDPETLILNNEQDWAHPADPETYPYYISLADPAQVHHPFAAGDRIPDLTYVVVKALGRDDPRDKSLRPGYQLALPGFVNGARSNLTGGIFNFRTGSSVHDSVPNWTAVGDEGWYADTLGILVAPRSEFTFNMTAIDEHARRDGTPAQLSFDVGYEPCVQCIEILPSTSSVSSHGPDTECYDPEGAGHPCFDDQVTYYVSSSTIPALDELQPARQAYFAIDQAALSGFEIVDNLTQVGPDRFGVQATIFNMVVLFHGQDDPREQWANADWRTMAWRYQIDYDCDPLNQIQDGGSQAVDSIDRVTWQAPGGTDGFEIVDDGTGVWKMTVEIAVPTQLLSFGFNGFYFFVLMGADLADGDTEIADELYEIVIRQLGDGMVRAVALDQTSNGMPPTPRPTTYNYFQGVRPTVATPPSIGTQTWRDPNLFSGTGVFGRAGQLDMAAFAMESNGGKAVARPFRIVARTPEGDVVCEFPTK